jgi:hypothetical protein
MPRPGSISPKAAATLNSKLAVLRQTRPQKSKMAAFNKSEKDEGSAHKKAEIPNREINHPTNQGGGAAYGRRVSKGGSVGKSESQLNSRQINQPENAKTWPKGGGVSAGNPATGNTRMKGPIAKTGGPYGGGGRATQ